MEISLHSQENTCTRVSFFNEVAGLRCFPVNFAKFLRTPILKNISGGSFCLVNHFLQYLCSAKILSYFILTNLR